MYCNKSFMFCHTGVQAFILCWHLCDLTPVSLLNGVSKHFTCHMWWKTDKSSLKSLNYIHNILLIFMWRCWQRNIRIYEISIISISHVLQPIRIKTRSPIRAVWKTSPRTSQTRHFFSLSQSTSSEGPPWSGTARQALWRYQTVVLLFQEWAGCNDYNDRTSVGVCCFST